MRLYTLLFTILILFINSAFCSEIAILNSRDIPSYNEVLNGFVDEENSKKNIYTIDEDDLNKDLIIKKITNLNPDVILAIGPKALELTKQFKNTPVVFCMVKEPEKYDLLTPYTTGILLEIPIEKELEILKGVLKNVVKIVTIYNPKYMQVYNLNSLLERFNVNLIQAKVDTENDVYRAIRSLRGIEAIWIMRNDPTLIHPKAFQTIIKYSITSRIPLLVPYKTLVEDGALFTISLNYFSIGIQAKNIVKMILNGTKVSDIPLELPKSLEIIYNAKTAQLFEYIEFTKNLINYSQNMGYKVSAIGE